MAEINAVGTICPTSDGVHWIIRNFYDFPQEPNSVLASPHILRLDGLWSIAIYPNGFVYNSTQGWFGIDIRNLNSDSDLQLWAVRLSIIGEADRNFVKYRAEIGDKDEYRCRKFVSSSFLKFWKELLVPGGNLHIFFDIESEKDYSVIQEPFIQILTEDADKWLKEKFENGFTEVATQAEEKNVKEDLKQKQGYASVEETTQSEKDNGMEKLCKDFREILLSGNISDIVLKAEDQEFKAHRCILAARSPVFLSMMMHESKEKISGLVDIPDVDPKTFADFLSYLYTGSMENITSENYAELYVTADKYQVTELKQTCLNHMMMNISIDNFCKVHSLAIRYEEEKLKEACIQFFIENSLEIILTSQWLIFLSENPKIGNELFIKHIQMNKRQ